ncbi:MAG: hypothetical protein IKD09_07810, partial [Lentisphaeria bacterium]|nr:hypothetical protein [Lentisphaeria bacterium]
EKEFGIYPPKVMHPEIGQVVQNYIDKKGGEIDSTDLRKIFDENFVNIVGPYDYHNYTRDILEQHGDLIGVSFTWVNGDKETPLKGVGNGPISAVYNALAQDKTLPEFSLEDFSERSLGNDADAKAIAFVGIRLKGEKRLVHGVGVHSNIDRAAIAALISALNRAVKK